MTTPPPSSSSRQSSDDRPSLWKVWFIASRPHTLTASISPVIVGSFATYIDASDKEAFRTLTWQWAWFCMFMQLGTNLHNDYADFVKGADTDQRVGQARATQKGWLSPTQTATAACGILTMGLAVGVNLFVQMKNHGEAPERLGYLIFIILSSIFNAFAYTGGPFPLGYIGLGNFSIGYAGLGDLFVFLYFGLVATLMIPFLYATTISRGVSSDADLVSLLFDVLPYAIQVACGAINIIVVNNLRDRMTDVFADKRTCAVRFGADFCRKEYSLLVLLAYALVFWDVYRHDYALRRLLPLLSAPFAWKELRAIHEKDGSDLNSHVGGAAKVQFLFCLLLSIGITSSAPSQQ
jgi:1,4-dihydroxy-2-naphthoate polyprenyltransferase